MSKARLVITAVTVEKRSAGEVARSYGVARECTGGPIFLASDGRRLDRHGAGRIVRRVARRAGITKTVGPHTLRHAFIIAALDAGVPLRDVQEAASHADPRTTMRYDRARTSLDRHATYIVAAYVAGAVRLAAPELVPVRLAGLRPGGPPPETPSVTPEAEREPPICVACGIIAVGR